MFPTVKIKGVVRDPVTLHRVGESPVGGRSLTLTQGNTCKSGSGYNSCLVLPSICHLKKTDQIHWHNWLSVLLSWNTFIQKRKSFTQDLDDLDIDLSLGCSFAIFTVNDVCACLLNLSWPNFPNKKGWCKKSLEAVSYWNKCENTASSSDVFVVIPGTRWHFAFWWGHSCQTTKQKCVWHKQMCA